MILTDDSDSADDQLADLHKTPSLWLLYVGITIRLDHKIDESHQVGTTIFGSFIIESQ